MWQLDPNGKLKDRIPWEGYRSGHMMYLRKEDLKTSNDHLRKFILDAIPDLINRLDMMQLKENNNKKVYNSRKRIFY